MKLTIHLTRDVPERSQYTISYPYAPTEYVTETVVEVTDVEFTTGLTASFLRALADEIDPARVQS